MHQWLQKQSKGKTTSLFTNAAFSIYESLLSLEKGPPNHFRKLSQDTMVALVLIFTTGSPIETSHANKILPVIPASNQPVSKNSFVFTSDFKISRPFRSLNVKRSVRILCLDWLLSRDLSDFGREEK